jgi:hypothetical protein
MVKMVAQREGAEPLWQYGIGSLDVLPATSSWHDPSPPPSHHPAPAPDSSFSSYYLAEQTVERILTIDLSVVLATSALERKGGWIIAREARQNST